MHIQEQQKIAHLLENTSEDDVYRDQGYRDRDHYLQCTAEDYGIDSYSMDCIADIMGEEEDFDGLITACEDFAEMF